MSKILEEALKCSQPVKIVKWKVREGTAVAAHQLLMLYQIIPQSAPSQLLKYKSSHVGTAKKVFVKDGDIVRPGEVLMELEECKHPTVMKDMCAECGVDLRQTEPAQVNASVPMVHSIPELKVSEELAQILGKADEVRLLKDRKLVLLVDLDQTLIHTTNDNIPPNLKDVVHFQLYGPHSPWYHTRIRPGTEKFLEAVSEMYELHICTFGARNYAHYIALFLDPDGRFFSHRILSRDECFDANSKTANLKALFPCGDSMVCIIDDREDVWNYAPNLIHVKPYHFFQHTGDINAPPGLTKKDNDTTEDGFDFTKMGPSKGKDYEESDKKAPAAVVARKKSAPSGETTTDKDTEDEKETRVRVGSRRQSAINESYSDVSKLNDTVDETESSAVNVSKGTGESSERCDDPDSSAKKISAIEKVENGETMEVDDVNQSTQVIKEVEKVLVDEVAVAKSEKESGKQDVTMEAAITSENESSKTDISESLIKKTNDSQSNLNGIDSNDDKTALSVEIKANTEGISQLEQNILINLSDDSQITNDTPPLNLEALDSPEQLKGELSTADVNAAESTATIGSLENVVKSLDALGGAVAEVGKSDENEKVNIASSKNGTGSVNDKSGKDEDEMIEVEDSDDYLLYLEDILRKIHNLYYKEYDARAPSDPLPDLKVVVPNAKNQVLAGCHLVFSGLVPSHVPLPRSRAYAVAVSLGAKVTVEVSSETTHLVAARAGTAKVNSSRRQKGVHIVTPHWLWHCAERWEKVDERLYPLARGVVTNRHPPAHCGSPQHPTEPEPALRNRTDSGRFSDTINPLLSFSPEDVLSMDQEVEALCADDTDSEESASERAIRTPVLPIVGPDSSSCDSMTGGSPKGYVSDNPKAKKRKIDTTTCTESDLEEDSPSAKFRRGEPLPSDLDLGEEGDSLDDTQDSQDGDDSAWNLMGAALEREFLSGD